MTALVDVLADTWRRWDRWPGDRHLTADMENLCQQFAAQLGMPSSRIRERMAGLRRDGYSHLEAVQLLAREHGRQVA